MNARRIYKLFKDNENDLIVLKSLIGTHYSPNYVIDHHSLIFHAIAQEDLIVLAAMLTYHDIAAQTYNGYSVLTYACHSSTAAVVRTILVSKPNVYQIDAGNWMPLQHAVYHGTAEIVELLLNNGVSVKKSEERRAAQTTLELAEERRHRVDGKKIIKLIEDAIEAESSQTNESKMPLSLNTWKLLPIERKLFLAASLSNDELAKLAKTIGIDF